MAAGARMTDAASRGPADAPKLTYTAMTLPAMVDMKAAMTVKSSEALILLIYSFTPVVASMPMNTNIADKRDSAPEARIVFSMTHAKARTNTCITFRQKSTPIRDDTNM